MLVFRQLFDPQSSTYTYLLGDRASGAAVLIDPVFEQVHRDIALLNELGLTLICSAETHVHADHVTGAWMLRRHFDSEIALAAAGGAEGTTRPLAHGDHLPFGPRHLEVRATPGHTDGCLTYVLDDHTMAFTGDCLLIRGCGRTDFQQGSPRTLYGSVHREIFSLPNDCLLYPGHDYRGLTVTSVDEERRFNPRLGGEISEADFTGYMDNLKLAHPRQIQVAVPANLKCGRRGDVDEALVAPTWADLTFTFAGIWEIQPQALEDVAGRVQIIDVRETNEFDGAMGHIPGAKLIPLGELSARLGEISLDQPVVTVCRSGARSAQAVVILHKEGFDQVANLGGGMLRWRVDGRATEGLRD
jgi:glyoxylase-like metal-dependent hydrolase (beta-lactamase superfamily II)/rhodanese-related sulfurtransferase